VNEVLESTPLYQPLEMDLQDYQPETDDPYLINPYKFDIYSLGITLAILLIKPEQREHLEKIYK
jgi:hypothetical protein